MTSWPHDFLTVSWPNCLTLLQNDLVILHCLTFQLPHCLIAWPHNFHGRAASLSHSMASWLPDFLKVQLSHCLITSQNDHCNCLIAWSPHKTTIVKFTMSHWFISIGGWDYVHEWIKQMSILIDKIRPFNKLLVYDLLMRNFLFQTQIV